MNHVFRLQMFLWIAVCFVSFGCSQRIHTTKSAQAIEKERLEKIAITRGKNPNEVQPMSPLSLTVEKLSCDPEKGKLQGKNIKRFFGGGTGTASDPFRVCSAIHWMGLVATAHYKKRLYYILASDLDFSSDDFRIFVVGGRSSFHVLNPFRGVLNGNGKTLRNIYLTVPVAGENLKKIMDRGFYPSFAAFSDDSKSSMGLFQTNLGQIENLKIERIRVIFPERPYGVGALVGTNDFGTIRNIQIKNAGIHGKEMVGGLVGKNYGYIEDVFVSPVVMGESHVGGLVGWNAGKIEKASVAVSVGNKKNSAIVAKKESAGGIVGSNYGFLKRVDFTGSVAGRSDVGGIAGGNIHYGGDEKNHPLLGQIIGARFSGRVIGSSSVGGVVGYNTGKVFQAKTLPSSTVRAMASDLNQDNEGGSQIPLSQAGGVVGFNSGLIVACENSANVRGEGATGGFFGYNQESGSVLNSTNSGVVESKEIYVGDFGGINFGHMNDCTNYRIDGVKTYTDKHGSSRVQGGLIGYGNGSFASSGLKNGRYTMKRKNENYVPVPTRVD